ncbi:hypothetical protein CCR85_02715 [Rhodothalassium salexigens]|uniref:class I SAM-dependent methyltransferase n=1 Tax=Rhodothalassium salexigens TaxID=1086 RepID=UPI0019146EDB|nr:class I SAM-dependent methyltransferase [Rhodothalassium salexigens]MBK5910402.1 hypothetical protein [Rhodothalassium salexigens]MBK5919519.1 hypothetical protein [Rhodothalassium salexigens]
MKAFYERHVLPHLVDHACGVGAIRWLRRGLVPEAQGLVVEVGFGTGRNLAYYAPERVERLIGIDPEPGVLAKARRRLEATPLAVEIRPLSAERLPLESGTVDTVVCTFSLCTIADPQAALDEMRRVLKPHGRLLFAEHGASPDARVRRWQERLNRPWRALAGGCNLNRPIDRLVADGGFALDRLDTGYMRKTPRVVGHYFTGVARPR